MCLYQRRQTTFEGAVGTDGQVQPGDAGSEESSALGAAPVPPLARAEQTIPEGAEAAVLGRCWISTLQGMQGSC